MMKRLPLRAGGQSGGGDESVNRDCRCFYKNIYKFILFLPLSAKNGDLA